MTYLSATLYINRLYQEQMPRIVLAEEGGFMDKAISGIGEYLGEIVKDIKDRPFAGIAAFLGPGILMTLGFPWMAIAYEVAGALGFDWVGLWNSLKNSVWDIIKGAVAPGTTKPNENDLQDKLTKATGEAIDQHVHDTVDEEALQKAHDKAEGVSLPKSEGGQSFSEITKYAGAIGAVAKVTRGTLTKIFKRIIPWAITTALKAMGFAVAGGAVRGVVGIKSKPSDSDESASKTRDPIFDYEVSPSVDPSLYEVNLNDENSVWLETGSILNIKSTLWSWISSAFPQLIKEQSNILNSVSFKEVENMFRNRNKMAGGLQIYSVPKPFEKKIDIVSYIVNGYLKAKNA